MAAARGDEAACTGSKACRGDKASWLRDNRAALLVAVIALGAVAGWLGGNVRGDTGEGATCYTEDVPLGLLATIRGKLDQRPVGLWAATDATEGALASMAAQVHQQLAECGLVAAEAIVRLDRGGDLDKAAQETVAAIHAALHDVGPAVLLVQVSDAILEAGLQEIVEGALDETMPMLVLHGDAQASHGLVLVVYSAVSHSDISGGAVVEQVRKSKRGVWDDRLVQRFGEVAVVPM